MPLTFGPDLYLHAKALHDDPVLFGQEILGRTYSPDQVDIARSVARPGSRTAVHSCHGSGKTFLGGDLVLWFISTRSPAKVITTAAGARSVDAQIWSEMRAAYRRARAKLGGRMLPRKSELIFSEDHFALGFSADDIHKFRGYHSPNLFVLVDEAAGVPLPIYTAIDGLTVGDNDRVLIQGNPGEPSGPYYDRCRGSEYHTIEINAHTQPNVVAGREIFPGMVTRRWVEERRRVWGEGTPLWEMLVEGRFPAQGINTLISLTWIEAAIAREPGILDQPTVIACDVAYEGTDETVILILENDMVTEIEGWHGRDPMETCGRLVRWWEKFKDRQDVRVVVDDIGVGAGIAPRLHEQDIPCIRFTASMKPWYSGHKTKKPDKRTEVFFNLRAQAWWWLREALRGGQVTLPQDDRLKGQLTSVLYRPRSDGTIQVESKDEMRKRGLHSPDRADALIMAWWARQLPQIIPEDWPRGRHAKVGQPMAPRWSMKMRR